jgi:aminopeptidase N
MPSPRLRVLSTVAVVAALALPASSLAAPSMTAVPTPGGSAGIGDSYFPLDGNGGINVLEYRIRDRYAFDTKRLSGSTVLRVRATDDLTVFNLDFLLPVTGVTIDGRRASYSKPRQHEVRITPRATIADGDRFTVRLTYAGFPDRRSYVGESNWLANAHEVVAMNEPHMAPWWFPSNDHPADKALMDIAITVPRGNQVFANGRPVSRRFHDGHVTRRWVADEPMATYLAMFAAGRFQVDSGVRDGLPWRAIVSKRIPLGQREANLDLMRRTPRIVAGLERDLGDYPFSTVGGLVTGLNVYFALENQTLPTYPATGRGYTLLVVHELAHQWLGDSVALHRWRDIWLNEGAATFMERRWVGNHGGQSAGDWMRQQYDTRSAQFWDLAIGDPGPDHLFHGSVYDRGAMTFQALRNRIGDADFWTVLERWVTDNRHGHGTQAKFAALAEEVSGEDLDGFFDAWLSAGKPDDTTDNGLG